MNHVFNQSWTQPLGLLLVAVLILLPMHQAGAREDQTFAALKYGQPDFLAAGNKELKKLFKNKKIKDKNNALARLIALRAHHICVAHTGSAALDFKLKASNRDIKLSYSRYFKLITDPEHDFNTDNSNAVRSLEQLNMNEEFESLFYLALQRLGSVDMTRTLGFNNLRFAGLTCIGEGLSDQLKDFIRKEHFCTKDLYRMPLSLRLNYCE